MKTGRIEYCFACGRLITGMDRQRRYFGLSMDASILDGNGNVVSEAPVYAPHCFVNTPLPVCSDACAEDALDMLLYGVELEEEEYSLLHESTWRDQDKQSRGWAALFIILMSVLVWWLWF